MQAWRVLGVGLGENQVKTIAERLLMKPPHPVSACDPVGLSSYGFGVSVGKDSPAHPGEMPDATRELWPAGGPGTPRSLSKANFSLTFDL